MLTLQQSYNCSHVNDTKIKFMIIIMRAGICIYKTPMWLFYLCFEKILNESRCSVSLKAGNVNCTETRVTHQALVSDTSRPANPWQRKIWRPMKKDLEILKEIMRFYFFPDQTPFPSRELDTNLIPRAYSPFKMADRRGEKRKVFEHKHKSQLFISLSLYGTNIPRKIFYFYSTT